MCCVGLVCRERLEEFVESEAELSGSDASSDEEDNKAGSGLDQYEDDGGGSDVPHSDTELHQQVNKIHMYAVSSAPQPALPPMALPLFPSFTGGSCWQMTRQTSVRSRSGSWLMGTWLKTDCF